VNRFWSVWVEGIKARKKKKEEESDR